MQGLSIVASRAKKHSAIGLSAISMKFVLPKADLLTACPGVMLYDAQAWACLFYEKSTEAKSFFAVFFTFDSNNNTESTSDRS